eukprot:11913613-Karenia_brevis.AAC.1
MGTGACWSEVLLEANDDMYVTLSDIKDYFYACGIPEELGDYFGLDSVPGWLVRELTQDTPDA